MPQTWSVSDLLGRLERDQWRDEHPFSPDVSACHEKLFRPGATRQEMAAAINDWLCENQPCAFGRMEAKQNRIGYCILTENDLEGSDQEIRQVVQQYRQVWKRTALVGATHGFLIAVVSRRIAMARPTTNLLALAHKICELYLGTSHPDKIHLDEVMLSDKELGEADGRKWKVGVNYFSAQGDGRWWEDHRIPGGLAFSMNSVGHMARTRVERIARKTDVDLSKVPREQLVYWALPNAMKTIGPPRDGSKRGTWLAERGQCPEDREPPSFEVRQRYFGELANFSENRYRGLYHTDQSIPSSYFDDGLWRREDLAVRDDLYFTYLHSLADADYESMGVGILVSNDLDGDPETNETRKYDDSQRQRAN